MSMPNVENAVKAANLSPEEFEIVKPIIGRGGLLRSSKPDGKKYGKAAYVWRMVAFQISPIPTHHCMPMTADFDLPAYDESGQWRSAIAREMSKELDIIVKKIVDCVPKSQWHGINRWARVYGIIS